MVGLRIGLYKKQEDNDVDLMRVRCLSLLYAVMYMLCIKYHNKVRDKCVYNTLCNLLVESTTFHT